VTQFTDIQLDALRELANIGSGNAGTALSGMLGTAVDITVPRALALPLGEAVEAVGAAEEPRTAVLLPVFGDLDAAVLLVFTEQDVQTLSTLLGVEPGTEVGLSALGEIGNIVGTSYINAIAQMIGIEVEPRPPHVVTDMLGAIVASALTAYETGDVALILDSQLSLEDHECNVAFVLLPSVSAVDELMSRLGLS
jgi:chemotaxis protein CheC